MCDYPVNQEIAKKELDDQTQRLTNYFKERNLSSPIDFANYTKPFLSEYS